MTTKQTIRSAPVEIIAPHPVALAAARRLQRPGTVLRAQPDGSVLIANDRRER